MELIKVTNLTKTYRIKENIFSPGRELFALKNFNLSLQQGQTLGIVGESGCGKSTFANLLMGLIEPSHGDIQLHGKSISQLGRQEKLKTQIIFQDPHSSLNPRKKIWQIIAEPLFIHTKLTNQECKEKVVEVLNQVGLNSNMMNRYPHMFSGGQKQRIGIARALIITPEILICDEPVSALDISVQAQILNLLNELKNKLNLTLIFISHDLSVVNYFCDQTLVMYLGEVVEHAETETLFRAPKHPYTQVLLKSSPSIDNLNHNFEVIQGEIPSSFNIPTGCSFKTRCSSRSPLCDSTPKAIVSDQHYFACHHPLS